MSRNVYSCESISKLIEDYESKGGHIVTIQEGTLGYGKLILFGDGLKTTIVQEVALNEWSSAHTIRMYNKTPEKYNKYVYGLRDGETMGQYLGRKLGMKR